MRTLFVVVACAGCAIPFDVDQSIPEQRVAGRPLGGLLPSFLAAPIPLTIGAEISATANGHQPTQDFTYDGLVTITVHI
jgi:hypothetical protein